MYYSMLVFTAKLHVNASTLALTATFTVVIVVMHRSSLSPLLIVFSYREAMLSDRMNAVCGFYEITIVSVRSVRHLADDFDRSASW